MVGEGPRGACHTSLWPRAFASHDRETREMREARGVGVGDPTRTTRRSTWRATLSQSVANLQVSPQHKARRVRVQPCRPPVLCRICTRVLPSCLRHRLLTLCPPALGQLAVLTALTACGGRQSEEGAGTRSERRDRCCRSCSASALSPSALSAYFQRDEPPARAAWAWRDSRL